LTLSNSSDIKNITLVKGGACKYVQFDVTNIWSSSCNAVISVLDADGTIMWSWFIWLKNDLKTTTITNSSSVNYDILSLHLASVYSGTSSYNWYYQWGRHIPQPGPNSLGSNSEESSNYGVRTFTISSNPASSLGEAIRNPHVCYHKGSSSVGWFGTSSFYNLWDANCTNIGASDNDVVKTVYDPCPVGFKMPNGNTFTGFTKIGTIANGELLTRYEGDTTGILFEYTGGRHCSDGDLMQVGYYGWVWTSASGYDSAYSGKNDVKYCLYFRVSYNPTTQESYNTYAASAFSVRPVKE
jgi:hypothetical protein